MTDRTISKFILEGTTDITRLMSGTSASFQFEVSECYVDGVATGYTWANGLLDIPGYTSGNVNVDFYLYLISGTLSKYLPKDPSNSLSDIVLWENRIPNYPNVSTQIKSIESGLVFNDVSTLEFIYRGGWDELATLDTSFIGKLVLMYRDNTILYRGQSDGHLLDNGRIAVSLNNKDVNIDRECDFDDPTYLNKIDLSSSNAFYTGSSIDVEFDGYAIPMVVGPRSAYEDREAATIPNGVIVSAVPPLVLPPVNSSSRKIGSGIVLRVIPLSSTVGILCRTPSFQSLQKQDVSEPIGTVRLWSKVTGDNTNNQNLIHSQLIGLTGGGGSLSNQSGRIIQIPEPGGPLIELCSEDLSTANYPSYEYDSKSHLCSDKPADDNFSGSITLSSQATPGGNTLWKITVSGMDLTDGEFYYVCTDITGSISAPKVSQWILEQHGLSVDSASFTAAESFVTTKATMQIGNRTFMPSINDVLGEINRSILAMIKKPLDSDEYGMVAIDIDPSTSITLTDVEIAQVKTSQTDGQAFGYLEMEPKYLRGTRIRDEVYSLLQDDTYRNITGIRKIKTIDHCLDQISSRWLDMVKFWTRPQKEVSFIMLDDSQIIDIGDYVSIDHDNFQGKIIVTKISPKQIGRTITGIKL